MKIFNNPIIVGVLAVVAVAVVAYQVMPHRSRAAAPPPAAETAPPPSQPASAAATAPETASTNSAPAMDVNFLQAHSTNWAETPQRDPFQTASAATAGSIAGLQLKAVWRQTGGSVAVINHTVYHEGDEVEGFTLDKIEDDQVWLASNGQRQSLRFGANAAAAH